MELQQLSMIFIKFNYVSTIITLKYSRLSHCQEPSIFRFATEVLNASQTALNE